MLKTLYFAGLMLHFFPTQMGEYNLLNYIPIWYNEGYIWRVFICLFHFVRLFFSECVFFLSSFWDFPPFLFCLFFSSCYRDKLQWWKHHQEFTVDIFNIVKGTYNFLERGPKFFISKISPLLTFTSVNEFCLLSVILGNWCSHEWHFSSKQSHVKIKNLLP